MQAVAVTPAALVAVEREGLLALLASSPELALRWTGALSRRLLAYQERVLTLLHKDLARQVATVLLLEQERTPADDRVVRLAHATIAQLLGASRQSVTRVIHDLRRWGLVEPGYRRLRLVDPAGLAHVARGRRPARRTRSSAVLDA
ncbi:MAG TPA: Crp/Fnr family transcriptional regulator [Egibacteraceae bacterium]